MSTANTTATGEDARPPLPSDDRTGLPASPTEREAGDRSGDGRRRLLDAAGAELVERGVGQLSLRAIARRAGLSHNAAGHHFGDRAGLLTAVAVDGFKQLTRTLDDARTHAAADGTDGFSALGRAYLDFGLARPDLLDLMFRPDLLRRDDPALAAAQQSAFGVLEVTATAVRSRLPDDRRADAGSSTGRIDTEHIDTEHIDPDHIDTGHIDTGHIDTGRTAQGEGGPGTELALVAWSFVHGLVGLARYGALDQGGGAGAAEIARGLLVSFGTLIGRGTGGGPTGESTEAVSSRAPADRR